MLSGWLASLSSGINSFLQSTSLLPVNSSSILQCYTTDLSIKPSTIPCCNDRSTQSRFAVTHAQVLFRFSLNGIVCFWVWFWTTQERCSSELIGSYTDLGSIPLRTYFTLRMPFRRNTPPARFPKNIVLTGLRTHWSKSEGLFPHLIVFRLP